ncbi:MAG: sulfite oxidase-like oxidoreductase [Planctomycetales bacterium]|jgi:DMSO/TMAO reductase YedYZ molybdopterin-dependent catalytic subunit|nr:sulfite oxidase-like oxidoreductase [Planctomycetales bacterium]
MSIHDDPDYQAGDPASPEHCPSGTIISPHTHRDNRIPPGQTRTRKWPVLDAFGPPTLEVSEWRLKVFGLVENPYALTFAEFQDMPRVTVFSDFHCVTRWSLLGNLWEGVATRDLLERATVKSAARYVICHGSDNAWSTNLPLVDFLQSDCLLADRHDGSSISREHGGPVRGVIPQLYAWKSAKWICGIELVAEDRAGYWEQCGYHMRGDPWNEERFGVSPIRSGDGGGGPEDT